MGNATSTGNVPNSFTFNSWTIDSQTGYYYTGSGYYDPATGQSFGCKDKGPYDTPGSEDFCGEDENRSSDSLISVDPGGVKCDFAQPEIRRVAKLAYRIRVTGACTGTVGSKAELLITLSYAPGFAQNPEKLKNRPVIKICQPMQVEGGSEFSCPPGKNQYAPKTFKPGYYRICATATLTNGEDTETKTGCGRRFKAY
jgi:hypothetical protein